MKPTDVFLVLCPLFYTKLPPLSLAYLSEALDQNGIGHRCHDLNIALYQAASEDEKQLWNVQNNPKLARSITKDIQNGQNPTINCFLNNIIAHNPKIISFSVLKSNVSPTLECIGIVKKHGFKGKIVCGGPEVGYLVKKSGAKTLKNLGIDVIIMGEGEKALTKLAQDCPESDELLVMERQEEDRLDIVPYPSFAQLDRKKYDISNTLPLLMSRGCIRQCCFCSERLLYDGYRVRSADHVVTEIKEHVKKGIGSFVFHDSLINGDLLALESLCDKIIEERLRISWEAQCVVRHDMSMELLKKMQQAGCYNLFIGLESASNAVLKRMNKGITTEDVRTFFKKCKDAGLHFEISLITNFPEESAEEFQETCDFISAHKALIPKIAQVNPYVPYEGTATGENHPRVDEQLGRERMSHLVELFEREGIPYTKSYIGNLLPG